MKTQMKTTTPTLAAALALALWTQSSHAQNQRQWGACVNDGNALSPDVQISACTAVLRSGQLNRHGVALTLTYRGIAYDAKGDQDRAIADFSEAIRSDPSASAFTNRGHDYMLKDNYDGAIADFDAAIRLDPEDSIAFEDRGRAYTLKALRLLKGGTAETGRATGQEKANLDRAIRDFTEEIRLEPQRAYAYTLRGLAWGESGDDERAAADFRRAADLGDPDAAEELKKLAASPPANEPARSSPAPAPDQSGDTSRTASTTADEQCTEDSKSIPACTRLIASGGLNGKELADAYYHRGFGYWLEQKYKLAIRDYDSAAQLVPDYPDYYWWRGCAYQRTGNRRAAKADFERGRKLGYGYFDKDAPCGY